MSASTVSDRQSLDVEGIGLDRHRPGRHRARLEPEGIAVWAIVANLQGTNGDVARTAFEYAISEDAVRRAIAYYDRNRELIDAFLLVSRAEFE